MLRRLFDGIKQGVGKVFGVIKEPLRKIGQFALTHHQPISALINAATSRSENPYLKAVGSAAVLGSSLATRAGIGGSYGNTPPFNQSPS
jgi:hypothetical protein